MSDQPTRNGDTQGPRLERLILTFSPLPQDALTAERNSATDAEVLRLLRRWGDHLARAIRIADTLAGYGWRLSLLGETLVAEKHATREELAALAVELREELRLLTASAEGEPGPGAGYLALDGDAIRGGGDADFRPLVEE